MESAKKAKSGLAAGGTTASIAIISVIYAMVNELSSGITLGEGDVSLNFGIFVPASAAILFGKGIGGAAAGLGALLTEFQDVLTGREDAASLDFNVLLNSVANFAGAYITGFLTQFKN